MGLRASSCHQSGDSQLLKYISIKESNMYNDLQFPKFIFFNSEIKEKRKSLTEVKHRDSSYSAFTRESWVPTFKLNLTEPLSSEFHLLQAKQNP